MTPRIVSNPTIMLGKPVIDGTRITVELILDRLAAGETVEDLLVSFPHITREGVQSALAYASKVLKNEVVYPLDEGKAA